VQSYCHRNTGDKLKGKSEIEVTQRRFHRTADAARLHNRLENPWIHTREKKLLTRLAKLCPDATSVLEVGCGEGSNLYYLKSLIPSAHFAGIDFSPAKVAFARELLPTIHFECADALALPFPDGSFDFVFCRDLLHHVDFDRRGVLREMQRVVKHRGVIAIYEGRGLTPLNLIFQLFYPVERGLRHSSPTSLYALVKSFGRVEMQFAAASFLLPATGFVLGWPKNTFLQVLCNVVYALASALEKCMEKLIPQHLWGYMLVSLRKE